MTKIISNFKWDCPGKSEKNIRVKVLPVVSSMDQDEQGGLRDLCFPRKMAPQKEKESWTARLCLREAMQEMGLEPGPLALNLRIDGHHHLHHFPRYCVSLSHTDRLAAAMVADQEHFRSVGIDVEHANRPMNESFHRFYINEEDDLSWSPLELWTLKEAAFKAMAPLHLPWEKTMNANGKRRNLVLKDIWVKGNAFGPLLEGPLGELSCQRFTHHTGSDYQLAIALIPTITST